MASHSPADHSPTFLHRLTSARRLGTVIGISVVAILIGLIISCLLPAAGPASAAVAEGAPASCRTTESAADCDIDHDRIPDVVELLVCDTLTCTDGSEDGDTDGIADWVEVSACDSVTCADPRRDGDDDGIPDFAEAITCGSTTCSDSRENRDHDAATDWAEIVICGDPTCASGIEDYDENGIADAAELQACVRSVTDLALTGSTIAWVAVLAALGLIAGGVLLRMRRARRANAGDSESADYDDDVTR